MRFSALATFWVVTLLLVATPGADWAFTLSAALRGNAVASAVGGLATGYAAMTAVVAAGVGALVAGSPAALTVLTLVGGAYLIWLGGATLRHPAAPGGPAAAAARTERGTFREGIGVSGLNPKGLLVFAALLPQFASRQASWPVALQLAVLGVTFTATVSAFYYALGTVARRVVAARPDAGRALSRVSGAGMVLIGTLLLADRLLG